MGAQRKGDWEKRTEALAREICLKKDKRRQGEIRGWFYGTTERKKIKN